MVSSPFSLLWRQEWWIVPLAQNIMDADKKWTKKAIPHLKSCFFLFFHDFGHMGTFGNDGENASSKKALLAKAFHMSSHWWNGFHRTVHWLHSPFPPIRGNTERCLLFFRGMQCYQTMLSHVLDEKLDENKVVYIE